MPRRVTLTDRQKDALLRLPTSQTDLLKHYTGSAWKTEIIPR